jgi:glycosyltransferase involved in cell wall biosynthesis
VTYMKPTVSVIIPSYNYARFLPETIDSVLSQTYPATQVIVVDDESTDDTPRVMAQFGSKILGIRKKNGGVSAAINAGAERATGDYLAFLDADDVWLPRKLELQMARFQSDPDLGLVHCATEEIDAIGNVTGLQLGGQEGWVANEMLLLRRPVILGGGSSAVTSRPIFDAVGGFDPRITVSQDWDFCFRVARRHRVGFVPEILMRYRLHGKNGHCNVRKMERDMLLAFQKAFADPDPELRKIRRRCYGNLHTMLAGSFFSIGEYGRFSSNALRAIALTPSNASRFVGFPIRKLRALRKPAPAAATAQGGGAVL